VKFVAWSDAENSSGSLIELTEMLLEGSLPIDFDDKNISSTP